MARWKPDAAGRLMSAALALFVEQGYDQTTVEQIAQRAGLNKRTFFRYFADKREVLFSGSGQLVQVWVGGVRGADADCAVMAAVDAGLDAVAALFGERHDSARLRAQIVADHAELQERELIKLQSLAAALTQALLDRGVGEHPATLAAQAGVTVFHVAFARWVHQGDPYALRRLLSESLQELRAVTSSPA